MYRCSSTKVYPSEGNARCTVVTVRFIVDWYLASVRTARAALPCRRYVSDDCILPSGLDLELDKLSLVLNARTGVLAPVPDSCYPREAIRERSALCFRFHPNCLRSSLLKLFCPCRQYGCFLRSSQPSTALSVRAAVLVFPHCAPSATLVLFLCFW